MGRYVNRQMDGQTARQADGLHAHICMGQKDLFVDDIYLSISISIYIYIYVCMYTNAHTNTTTKCTYIHIIELDNVYYRMGFPLSYELVDKAHYSYLQ